MPRKKQPWLRLYTEVIYDDKLRMLDPALRWVWIAVLALAKRSPSPGRLLNPNSRAVTILDIVDAAKVPEAAVREALAEFSTMEMLHTDQGAFVVTNWKKRQFESDDVTTRANASRDRRKEQEEGLQRCNSENTTNAPSDHSNVANTVTTTVNRQGFPSGGHSNVAHNSLSNGSPFARTESQSPREFNNQGLSSIVDVCSPSAREQTSTVRNGFEQSSFWSDEKTAAVAELEEITGDRHSRARWAQLWDLAYDGGRVDIWQAAIATIRARRNKSGEPLENPGAYANDLIGRFLGRVGIYVPVGTPEERAEIKGVVADLRASLADADDGPDPRGKSP